MGYLHTGLLAPFSWSPLTVKRWYTLASRFFAQSAKESVDYLAMSYRTGTFSKLQELLDFRDLLMNSQQNQLVLVESAILEMVLISGSANSGNFGGLQQLRNINVNPEHRLDPELLVDNRDLEVIIRWDPIVINDFDDEATKERKRRVGLEFVRKQSFKEQVLLLTIRKALLNLVVAQVNCLTGLLHHGKQFIGGSSENRTEAPSTDFVATLRTLRDEWSALFKSVPEVQQMQYTECYLVNILLSRLHIVTQVPYETFMSHLSALSLALVEGGHVNVKGLGASVAASMTGLVQLVRDAIKQQNEAKDPFWTYRKVAEQAASAVELLSLASLIVAVLERRSAKATGKANGATSKKSKRREDCSETDPANTSTAAAAAAATPTTTEWERAKQEAIGSVSKCLKEQLVALESLLGKFPRDVSLVLLLIPNRHLLFMCAKDPF